MMLVRVLAVIWFEHRLHIDMNNFFSNFGKSVGLAILATYCIVSAFSSAQTNTYNTLDHGQPASGLQTATSVVSVSGATAPTNGQCLTATSSTNATWQSCGGSSSWSSLTAPTANNSVTAAVDTSQTLLGHFDTSATAATSLFSLGEDVTSTKNATGINHTRMFTISTLAGSTAYPLAIFSQGFNVMSINQLGALLYTGEPDTSTGGAASGVNISGGSSASSNAAGSVFFSGGQNSSTGPGGNITLTPGTSTSGTAGANIFAGPTQLGSGTLTTPTGGLGVVKITADGTAPGAAGAKLELVCGTNAGSAKLIIYAGTSSTPITVVDNVGAGVTGC